MIGVVGYEWLRLRSLRSTWCLAAAAVAAAALVCWGFSLVVGDEAAGPVQPGEAALVLLTRSPLTLLVPGVLGVLAATADHRHGLALITQSVEPRRGRAPIARAFVVGAFAAALVAVCVTVAGLIAVQALPGQADVGSVLPQLAVFTLLGAGWGAIGVAVGTMLRSQGSALALLVLWPFTLEPLIRLLSRAAQAGWLDKLVSLLPAAAGDAAMRTQATSSGGLLRVSEGMPAPWAGGLAFGAFVALALALAAAANHRRDALL